MIITKHPIFKKRIKISSKLLNLQHPATMPGYKRVQQSSQSDSKADFQRLKLFTDVGHQHENCSSSMCRRADENLPTCIYVEYGNSIQGPHRRSQSCNLSRDGAPEVSMACPYWSGPATDLACLQHHMRCLRSTQRNPLPQPPRATIREPALPARR